MTEPGFILKNFSASKFETYKQCPWKFWAEYFAKKGSGLSGKYMNAGNTTHAVTDAAGKEKETPTREWIIDKTKEFWLVTEDDQAKFEEYKEEKGYERWQFLGYDSKEEEVEYQKLVLQMLFDYLLNKTFIRPFKTEMFLTYDWIDDLKLIIKVDRIEVFDENGEPIEFDYGTTVEDLKKREKFPLYTFKILDFKTGKKRLTKFQMRNDIAMNLYAWASLKYFGLTEDDLPRFQVGHYYLRRTETGEEPGEVMTELTSENIAKAFHKMEQISQDVAKGIFPKKEQFLCNYCDFKKECRGEE